MKTPLITREGYDKLKQELDFLWRQERPEVTKKVTWAASLGDRSENADYQYNKKRLREIDRRVRYLTKCLENLKIVDYSPSRKAKFSSVHGWKSKMTMAIHYAFALWVTTKFLAAKTTSPLTPQWRARY